MENTLKNKIAVVIGGAQGIGYGIADQFLLHGAKVVILDIDAVQGSNTVKNLTEKHGEDTVDFIKCDVTKDLDNISKEIFDNYVTVDVLVLSAGIPASQNHKAMVDVYVTSVIEWSMKFLQHKRKDEGGNGGTIIAISSIFGFRPEPHFPVYQAAKYAVNGFAQSLGHVANFAKTGVRVVALCPGLTETGIATGLKDPEQQKMLPDDLVKFANSMPWQTIEDVGNAAVEVYDRADSGTVWLIEGGKPITQVL